MSPSFSDIARDVASELFRLERDATVLQDHLGGVRLSEASIVALQSLDHLTQTLGCLAAFMSDVADQISPHLRLDVSSAIEAVSISRLAGRLAGAGPDEHVLAEGECELFQPG